MIPLVMTEPQKRAITIMGSKHFGKDWQADIENFIGKPFSQFTRVDASTVIDRMRGVIAAST